MPHRSCNRNTHLHRTITTGHGRICILSFGISGSCVNNGQDVAGKHRLRSIRIQLPNVDGCAEHRLVLYLLRFELSALSYPAGYQSSLVPISSFRIRSAVGSSLGHRSHQGRNAKGARMDILLGHFRRVAGFQFSGRWGRTSALGFKADERENYLAAGEESRTLKTTGRLSRFTVAIKIAIRRILKHLPCTMPATPSSKPRSHASTDAVGMLSVESRSSWPAISTRLCGSYDREVCAYGVMQATKAGALLFRAYCATMRYILKDHGSSLCREPKYPSPYLLYTFLDTFLCLSKPGNLFPCV